MPSGVQHTSTPCGRNSAHKPSAKLCWNAFTAEYTASVAEPATQASDATSTMPPRPRSRITVPKWWANAMGPMQSSLICLSE